MNYEYDLQYLRIAIVDDSPFMVNLIRYMLEHLGCRHVTAANNAAALMHEIENSDAQDKTLIPDIIISDWAMKPSTGLDLVTWLRRHRSPEIYYTPFIMLSAYSTMEHVITARNAGANEFLTKPLSTQTLVQRLVRIIEKPRPFIRAASYFGPDRRWRGNLQHRSQERRTPRAIPIRDMDDDFRLQ